MLLLPNWIFLFNLRCFYCEINEGKEEEEEEIEDVLELQLNCS